MVRIKKYIAELLGSAMFVFFGCGAGIALGLDHKKGTGYLITALIFGLVYFVLYVGLARVSGCHLNPVISFSMLVTKKIDILDFVGYTIAQIAGAFGGCGIMTYVFWGHTGNYGANSYYDADPFNSLLIETLVTMVFVSVFLFADESDAGNVGLARSIGVMLVSLFTIHLTGGSSNPAKALASAVFAGGEYLSELVVFIIGAFLGAVLAWLLYLLFSTKSKSASEHDGKETEICEASEDSSEDSENC